MPFIASLLPEDPNISMLWLFISKFLNLLTNLYFSYHENGPNAHLGDFTNSSWMDQYMWDCVTLLKNKSKGFSPLWNGETSTMSGGGAVNMSSRYVSGFLWLDKLGLSATYGIDVVMRQALIGGGGPYPFGNYTMLDKYGLPLPVRKGNHHGLGLTPETSIGRI